MIRTQHNKETPKKLSYDTDHVDEFLKHKALFVKHTENVANIVPKHLKGNVFYWRDQIAKNPRNLLKKTLSFYKKKGDSLYKVMLFNARKKDKGKKPLYCNTHKEYISKLEIYKDEYKLNYCQYAAIVQQIFIEIYKLMIRDGKYKLPYGLGTWYHFFKSNIDKTDDKIIYNVGYPTWRIGKKVPAFSRYFTIVAKSYAHRLSLYYYIKTFIGFENRMDK